MEWVEFDLRENWVRCTWHFWRQRWSGAALTGIIGLCVLAEPWWQEEGQTDKPSPETNSKLYPWKMGPSQPQKETRKYTKTIHFQGLLLAVSFRVRVFSLLARDRSTNWSFGNSYDPFKDGEWVYVTRKTQRLVGLSMTSNVDEVWSRIFHHLRICTP